VDPTKLKPQKGAHNCKWAEPTLFEPAPEWTDAERAPWTCHRQAVPMHLESTEVCEECPRWEARPDGNRKP